MSNGKPTPGPWYESSTGTHQGLIISENTGENIAVSYDKANAKLIAAAPDLKDTLVGSYGDTKSFIVRLQRHKGNFSKAEVLQWLKTHRDLMKPAIHRATS